MLDIYLKTKITCQNMAWFNSIRCTYVKQDLVFEKFTGALFGFTDLGEVNKQLDEFEAPLKNNVLLLQRPLTKTMIVLCLRIYLPIQLYLIMHNLLHHH